MSGIDKTQVALKVNSKKPDAHKHESVKNCLLHALDEYFNSIGDQTTHDLHSLVIKEVEATLLEATLAFTNKNQSKAAEVLGLNRGTLRKKLKEYGLL